MRSVLAKQELLHNNSTESKNIDIQQLSVIMKQTKYFSDIADNEKMLNDKMKKVVDAMSEDKKIQVASFLEAAKTDKDIREDDKKLQDKVDKLVKLFEKSTSNTQKLVEEAKKQTQGFSKLTGANTGAIADKALAMPQYKTIGDRIGDLKDRAKSFMSVKGFLNETGIIDKNSTGIFATAINRRHDMKEYVQDRFKVDPQSISMEAGKIAKKNGVDYKTLSDDEKEVYKKQAKKNLAPTYENKFKEQEVARRDLAKNRKEIDKVDSEIKRLQDRGYSEEQIKRSGLLEKKSVLTSKQDEFATAYAATDTRMKPLLQGGSTSTDPKEAAQEQADLIADQLKILETIANNTAETNKLLGGEAKKKKEQEKEPAKEKSLLSTAADALGDLSIPGMGKKAGKKAGKTIAGKAAGGLLGKMGPSLLKGAKGFSIGSILGIGGDIAAEVLGRDTKAGGVASTLGETASYAGTGAMIGSIIPGVGTAIGAGVGGLFGLGKGLYDNWGALTGKSDTTKVTAGENGKIAQEIYGGSANVQSMKENGAAQTAPVVVAPSTVNNNNTQVTKFDLPTRKNDDSLNRYTGSRLAY